MKILQNISLCVAAGAVLSILPAAHGGDVKKAVAVVHAASGSQVAGTVTFTQTADGVSVVADITGLAPGKHGFHIHEFGDASAVDLRGWAEQRPRLQAAAAAQGCWVAVAAWAQAHGWQQPPVAARLQVSVRSLRRWTHKPSAATAR